MKLSHFQFDLPKELAEYPAENRDEARLMVIDRKKGTIEHKMFKDVIDYFDDGDVLILNNTKVFQRVCMETKKQVLESKFFY
jgi:S-adenosylmethionine:tRNA ribosyltransferase-isomerase